MNSGQTVHPASKVWSPELSGSYLQLLADNIPDNIVLWRVCLSQVNLSVRIAHARNSAYVSEPVCFGLQK